ncbi:MBL fold metallo-hydrolase [Cohnella zeiphila]|uniref:Ribonuclease Z n=1 Tax=Cohnella zeiphila TaxID=2761120 RepID=A0A7X0VT72_9BACL|nr:MBL fold metallo-hydrolase [Cohnella zeiphila]MBB6729564.1 ribonuclease Z [Cohnella zeiphila]
MRMEIQMLGTGSAFAKAFYNTNALVYAGGRTLLVDCGTTGPSALHRLGKPLSDIDAVLVTHIHADHIGGLEELAFQYRFKYNSRPVLYLAEALAAPLWEHSLRGGLEQDGFGSLEAYFDVRPLRPEEPRELLPGLTAELLATRHIPNKLSYSVLFNGTFFYSADMVFDPELLRQLVEERGVETIFHDCQLFAPGAVHACLPELLTLPDSLQERIYLMHYGDDQPGYIGRTGKMKFVDQHRIYSFPPGR